MLTWWDQPASADFVEGLFAGSLLMALPAIVLIWVAVRRQKEILMSRLSDLVAEAAAVAPRQAAKIEKRARAIIESEKPLEDLQDESFGPHEAVLSEAESSMHDLKHSLAPLSNNPPLSTSGDSPPVPLQPGSTASSEPGT